MDHGPHARVEVPASPGGVWDVCGVWGVEEKREHILSLKRKQEAGSPISQMRPD